MRSAVRIWHLAFAVSGDQSDDVLAGPVLQLERGCLGGGDAELDLACADPRDKRPRHADRFVAASTTQPSADRRPDIPPLVAEAWPQCERSAQQRRHAWRSLAICLQLHVIDAAQRFAFEVDEKTVEKSPRNIECVVHYRPAFVAIINGMAANDATTMMTR